MLAASIATSTGQYINPDDILSPLSTAAEMDSKSSPLAMLAKTCSQIGADPIAPSSSSNKTGSSLKKNSPDLQNRHRNSPGSHGSSSLSDSKSCNLDSTDTNTRSPNSTHNNKSRSRSSSTEIRVTDNMTTVNSSRKLSGRDSNPGPGASPSLLKINSHSANPVPSVNSTRPLPPSVVGSYPSTSVGTSGVSTMSNPTSATSAAALLNNPFLASFASSLQSCPESIPGSATGSATGSGSVCRDPLCRDPLCPTALRNHQQIQNNFTYSSLLQTSSYYKEAMMAFTLQQRMAALAAAPPPGAVPGGTLPHVCNWVAGTEYCGRRFANAEELLVHVKTHTNLSTSSDPRALSILNASSPPPTSHHRFHPYARPLGVPHPASPSIPPLTTPTHPALAALASNPYASLYTSLFSRPPLL